MANENVSLVIIKSLTACATSAIFGFLMYKMLQRLDPNYEAKKNAKKRVIQIMAALKLDPAKIKLDSYEIRLATLISTPDNGVNIDEVGGCAEILSQLRKGIILPLRLISNKVAIPSGLYSPPKGVLLHGPPGCGKTLIARAIAREVDAFFINFDISVLNDMWYGESAKLTKALFSLSDKIQPCVIFIDEIDSVLRTRHRHDHEVTAVMKTQFMVLWDGFLNTNSTVIIIGATNRSEDVDEAILRRLPLKIHVPLPNLADRTRILRVILRNENLADDFDFDTVAHATEAMSGADLKEVVRFACLSCYELVAEQLFNASAEQREQRIAAMKLSHTDVIRAAEEFRTRTTAADRSRKPSSQR